MAELVDPSWAVPQGLMRLVVASEAAFSDDLEYTLKMCRSARSLRAKRATWTARRMANSQAELICADSSSKSPGS